MGHPEEVDIIVCGYALPFTLLVQTSFRELNVLFRCYTEVDPQVCRSLLHFYVLVYKACVLIRMRDRRKAGLRRS